MTCRYEPATRCTHTQPGTAALSAEILEHTDHLAFNGIYNCRPPRGTSVGYSTHAEGRACDISAALPNGQPNGAAIPTNSPADLEIHSWIDRLVQHRDALGVQRIIYKRTEWRCDRGYFNASPGLAAIHMNHMHVEQNRVAAATLSKAAIHAILFSEEDDLFTDADRELVRETNTLLKQFFGLNADGTARDIRAKLDAVYIEVADETTTGSNVTLGGRLKHVEQLVTPPKV